MKNIFLSLALLFVAHSFAMDYNDLRSAEEALDKQIAQQYQEADEWYKMIEEEQVREQAGNGAPSDFLGILKKNAKADLDVVRDAHMRLTNPCESDHQYSDLFKFIIMLENESSADALDEEK